MKTIVRVTVAFSLLGVLFACTVIQSPRKTHTISKSIYSEPSDSGLIATSPYPTAEDVCVSLHSNSVTKLFEAKNHFLIACPLHELGAIEDRESQQNAIVVGTVKKWVVLSVPVT